MYSLGSRKMGICSCCTVQLERWRRQSWTFGRFIIDFRNREQNWALCTFSRSFEFGFSSLVEYIDQQVSRGAPGWTQHHWILLLGGWGDLWKRPFRVSVIILNRHFLFNFSFRLRSEFRSVWLLSSSWFSRLSVWCWIGVRYYTF